MLDTDGVNAFASPGGLVHVTRGALGLAKNEAELAGVLGHEIGHVVRKHTVNAIRKSNAVKLGSEAAGNRSAVLSNLANRAYEMVLENNFDRSDELDADRVGVGLTIKAGYAAKSLGDFLTTLTTATRTRPSATVSSRRTRKPESGSARLRSRPRRRSPRRSSSRATSPASSTEVPPIASIAVVTEGSAGLDRFVRRKSRERRNRRRRGSAPAA